MVTALHGQQRSGWGQQQTRRSEVTPAPPTVLHSSLYLVSLHKHTANMPYFSQGILKSGRMYVSPGTLAHHHPVCRKF